MTIIAAADGSALGNPGPSGWGWYVDDTCWASGGWAHGTNNMGELMAVLDLLQQTAHLDDELHVICDSTYVINSITKWMPGWKRKGWRKGDGKPVMNVELMKAIDAAMQGRRVKFEWVKGHTGHELNEHADRLATAAAAAFQAGEAPQSGPGFSGASTAHPDAMVGQTIDEPDLFSEVFDELEAHSTPALSEAEQVMAAERSLQGDELRADPAAYGGWLHPEWSEIDHTGRLVSREEKLAELAPLAHETSVDLVSCEAVGSARLLVWRELGDAATVLHSSWWTQSTSGWQQRFHQATTER